MAAAMMSSVAAGALVGRTTFSRASRSRVVVTHAAGRPTWYPGATPPSYLDGSTPGDRGYDPLRICAKPGSLVWFKEAELYNGRIAMLACAGILFTDFVGVGGTWWTTGGTVDLPFPLGTLIAIELFVWAGFEYFRWNNIQKYGEGGLLNMVPFDPLGMKSERTLENEVKNGRLAMISFVGYASQAAVTGLSPIEALKAHIADPGHVNIYTSKVGPEFTLAVIALAIWPSYIEAKKALSGDKEDVFTPIPY